MENEIDVKMEKLRKLAADFSALQVELVDLTEETLKSISESQERYDLRDQIQDILYGTGISFYGDEVWISSNC